MAIQIRKDGKIKSIETQLTDIVNNQSQFYIPRRQLPADGINAPHVYNATLTQIYNLYDDLISKNQSYATKTILGKDQSNTYDVLRMDFKPKNPLYKIILGAGIHWEATDHVISLYNLMYDLCNNWDKNEFLRFLRWKVHIIVLPLENPYGFVHKIRQNSNNVDLNRNFDYNWQAFTGDVNTYYKGTAPFSEKETQYIRDVLLANRDALLYYCMHMDTAPGKIFRYYSATGNQNVVYNIMNNVMGYMQNVYPLSGDGAIDVMDYPQAFNYAEKVLGIYSGDLEGENDDSNPDTSSEHMTQLLAWYGNIIWSTIRTAIELKQGIESQWENKAYNGNYETIDGYEAPPPNIALSTVKNKLLATTIAPDLCAIRQIPYALKSGHRYYIRCEASISNITNVTSIVLYGRKSDASAVDITTINSPTKDTHYVLQGIIDATEDLKACVRVTGSANFPTGFVLTLYGDSSNGFLIIDLGKSTSPTNIYNASLQDITNNINLLGGWWNNLPYKNVPMATNAMLFAGRLQSQYPLVGSYIGDGVAGGKNISTKFMPKLIKIYSNAGALLLTWCTGMTLTSIKSITVSGFTVDSTVNTSATTYYYEIF